jgi:hypothetical protein
MKFGLNGGEFLSLADVAGRNLSPAKFCCRSNSVAIVKKLIILIKILILIIFLLLCVLVKLWQLTKYFFQIRFFLVF